MLTKREIRMIYNLCLDIRNEEQYHRAKIVYDVWEHAMTDDIRSSLYFLLLAAWSDIYQAPKV